MTGQTGEQGPTGAVGARGQTLVGPQGPSGYTGAAGNKGEVGQTGAQGSNTVGAPGAQGATGATGAQGPVGQTGAQGDTGVVAKWASYRDFWFETDKNTIQAKDLDKIREIAAYMEKNPTLQLGLDGSTNPRATAQGDQDSCKQRVNSVREALVQAGVPDRRISDGMFGDIESRRDNRVEIFIRTESAADAR